MRLGKKISLFLFRKILKLIILTTVFLNRVKIHPNPSVDTILSGNQPVIFVFWHKKIFFTIYRFRNSAARPLISHSGDGELVAQVAQEFRMNPIRGSSSAGGARAFINMLKSIREERSRVLITADGPKGPPMTVKDGTIKLAEKTGAAIIPISWTASRVKIFEKSWDRFELPLPFGKIQFRYGDPIYIQKQSDPEQTEYYKDLVQEGINSLDASGTE